MSVRRNKPTGWVGWIYFCSLLMVVLGGFQIIAGLVSVFNSSFYVVAAGRLAVFNYTAWGWIDFALGIVIMLAGIALLSGALWARAFAVLLAVLSLFANMAFLNAYPLWSILMIVVDVLIIYAITVHGSESSYD